MSGGVPVWRYDVSISEGVHHVYHDEGSRFPQPSDVLGMWFRLDQRDALREQIAAVLLASDKYIVGTFGDVADAILDDLGIKPLPDSVGIFEGDGGSRSTPEDARGAFARVDALKHGAGVPNLMAARERIIAAARYSIREVAECSELHDALEAYDALLAGGV